MKTFLNNDVDHQIIEERNNEIKKLTQDIEDISEIMSDLSLLILEQGESLEAAFINVENSEIATSEAVESLAKTENYINKSKQILRSAGLIIGGTTVGAFGFIVGPIVGVVTLVSGGVLGTGIAYITNNFI